MFLLTDYRSHRRVGELPPGLDQTRRDGRLFAARMPAFAVAIGVKADIAFAAHMSASDPKRTSAAQRTSRVQIERIQITSGSACCPIGRASSDDPIHHLDSARVPSDLASSVAATARPPHYRGRRLQLRAAERSVLLGQLQTRLQELDLRSRTRMLCEASLSVLFLELSPSDQLKNTDRRSVNGHSATNNVRAPLAFGSRLRRRLLT